MTSARSATAALRSRASERRVSTSKYTYRPLSFEEAIAGYEDAPFTMIVVSTWRESIHWLRHAPAREVAQATVAVLLAFGLFAAAAFWAAI